MIQVSDIIQELLQLQPSHTTRAKSTDSYHRCFYEQFFAHTHVVINKEGINESERKTKPKRTQIPQQKSKMIG